MARVKNYDALIAAKEEQIKKAKEKVTALEKELEVLKGIKTEKELEEYKAKLLASQQAEGETTAASS